MVEVVWYLARSATQPDFTQLPPGYGTLFIHTPSQLPGGGYSPAAIPAHRTIQTHKPSLSYQVRTYCCAERLHVWAKCFA